MSKTHTYTFPSFLRKMEGLVLGDRSFVKVQRKSKVRNFKLERESVRRKRIVAEVFLVKALLVKMFF